MRYARRNEAALISARGPAEGPVIFALWHGTFFPWIYYWRAKNVCVVTSRSGDGQMLAGFLRRMGYRSVRGSSTRGGARALIDVTRLVRSGEDVVLALDGPHGPARHAKPGSVLLAKLTGRPILPIAATSNRYWQFQSWDRFRLPLPGSRTLLAAAPPIWVPADADGVALEQYRVALETSLQHLQQDVDLRMPARVIRLPDRRPRDCPPSRG